MRKEGADAPCGSAFFFALDQETQVSGGDEPG